MLLIVTSIMSMRLIWSREEKGKGIKEQGGEVYSEA